MRRIPPFWQSRRAPPGLPRALSGRLARNNLVARWFLRRRGLALGLAAQGFSLSLAVYPPLTAWLMALVGWRRTWLWPGRWD